MQKNRTECVQSCWIRHQCRRLLSIQAGGQRLVQSHLWQLYVLKKKHLNTSEKNESLEKAAHQTDPCGSLKERRGNILWFSVTIQPLLENEITHLASHSSSQVC